MFLRILPVVILLTECRTELLKIYPISKHNCSTTTPLCLVKGTAFFPSALWHEASAHCMSYAQYGVRLMDACHYATGNTMSYSMSMWVNDTCSRVALINGRTLDYLEPEIVGTCSTTQFKYQCLLDNCESNCAVPSNAEVSDSVSMANHPANSRLINANATWTFECLAGYVIALHNADGSKTEIYNSSTTIQCLDGTWSPTYSCRKKCVLPSRLYLNTHGDRNGTLLASESASFTCELGYVPSHTDEVICNKNGVLVPDVPHCLASCSVPNLTDGTFSSQSVLHNESASFTCKLGYEAVTNDTRQQSDTGSVRCNNGTWEKTVDCLTACSIPTDSQPQIVNGQSVYYNSQAGGFVCTEGLEATVDEARQGGPNGGSTCVSGTWNNTLACVSACTIPEGTWTSSAASVFYSTETTDLTCHDGNDSVVDGLRSNGRTVAVSCENGSWNTQITCLPACTIPTSTTSATGDTVFYHGQSTGLTCAAGFNTAMDGSRLVSRIATVDCLNGLWSNVVDCMPGCPIPPDVISYNGQSVLYHGQTTELVCPSGNEAVINGVPSGASNASSSCLDGIWSDDVSCLAGCELPANSISANGLKQYYFHGDVDNFACISGFDQTGNGNLVCEMGLWNASFECGQPLQFCELEELNDATAQYPDHIEFLNPSCAGCDELVPEGETVTVLCDMGYEAKFSDNASALCWSNSSWSNYLSPCSKEFPMSNLEETIATTMQVLGCSYILSILAFSIVAYFFFRQFNYEKTIQLLVEVTLFLAHAAIISVRDFTGYRFQPGDTHLCRFIAAYLHYFFALHFVFLALEGYQVFVIKTSVSTRYYGRPVIVMTLCFVVAALPVFLSVQHFVDGSYHGYWSCWLNYSEKHTMYIVVPLALCVVTAMSCAEASAVWEERVLPMTDKRRKMWARIAGPGVSLITPLSTAAYFFGSFAVHAQMMSLYVVVFWLNIATGYSIFTFHTMAHPKAVELVEKWKNKICGRVKETKRRSSSVVPSEVTQT